MNRSRQRKMGDGRTPVQVAAGDDAGKDPAAQALGSKGGRKRAERLTAQRRSEIAKLAATVRWSQKQIPSESRETDGRR